MRTGAPSDSPDGPRLIETSKYSDDIRPSAEIRILGALEIWAAGEVRVPRRRLTRVLLGALALRPNTPVPMDWIVDALWNGSPPRSAQANIRSYVTELRRLLRLGSGREPEHARAESPQIRSSGGRYTLVATEAGLDALRFRAHLGWGTQALSARRPGEAAARLRLACGLWRGPVLDGTAIPAAVASSAAVLEDRRLDAIEAYVEAQLMLGRHAELTAELAGLTVEHGLREQFWQQRMRALWWSGRPAEALAVYHGLARMLREELDTEPSPSTRILYERIRRGRPAVVVVEEPSGVLRRTSCATAG
jgi:DNA-binding SARP family transcriptional activator